ENLRFFLGRLTGQRISAVIIEREQLLFAGIGNGHGRNKVLELRARIRARGQQCVADNERVAAECFAIEKYAARQTERQIEAAVERTLEPGEFDAEIAQEAFGHIAPQCFWRLDRLAAAIADQRARPGRKFVALGVAAEVVVIVENENAGLRTDRATIEPCRGEAADAAADHDQIVSLFAWRIVD